MNDADTSPRRSSPAFINKPWLIRKRTRSGFTQTEGDAGTSKRFAAGLHSCLLDSSTAKTAPTASVFLAVIVSDEQLIAATDINALIIVAGEELIGATGHPEPQGHEADPIHVQMRALAKARGLDLDSLLDRAAMLFESPKSSPRLEPLDDHDIAILIEDDEHDTDGRLS